jgi:hypothetical protein
MNHTTVLAAANHAISFAAAKYVDVNALRNVFVVALVAGVGVTVLFSVAVRSLSSEGPDGTSAANRAIAGVCLLAVLAAVATGIWAVLAK